MQFVAIAVALAIYPLALWVTGVWLAESRVTWRHCAVAWGATAALVALALVLSWFATLASLRDGWLVVALLWFGAQIYGVGWYLGKRVALPAPRLLGFRRGGELATFSTGIAITIGIVAWAAVERSLGTHGA
jgi:hypothetical protein